MHADGSEVRILVIGDIVGKVGRQIVKEMLPDLRESLSLDLVIANAENSAAGSGITPKIFAELRSAGVDLMTLGDHAWKRKDNIEVLKNETLCLRPHNYPDVAVGKGWEVVSTAEGVQVAHAIVLVGTHTHVLTSDARFLTEGTAYITDLGMTGPYDSVIGRDAKPVLHKFLTSMNAPFTVAEENFHLCGVLLSVNPETGKASSIRPVDIARDGTTQFAHDVVQGTES